MKSTARILQTTHPTPNGSPKRVTRRPLAVDRLALREDVLERTAMLREKLRERSDAEELAGRLAIEQALGDRGLVSRMTGGWC